MNREERRKLAQKVLEVALDGDSSVDDLEWLLDEFHNTNGPEVILADLDYIERLERVEQSHERAHRALDAGGAPGAGILDCADRILWLVRRSDRELEEVERLEQENQRLRGVIGHVLSPTVPQSREDWIERCERAQAELLETPDES